MRLDIILQAVREHGMLTHAQLRDITTFNSSTLSNDLESLTRSGRLTQVRHESVRKYRLADCAPALCEAFPIRIPQTDASRIVHGGGKRQPRRDIRITPWQGYRASCDVAQPW